MRVRGVGFVVFRYHYVALYVVCLSSVAFVLCCFVSSFVCSCVALCLGVRVVLIYLWSVCCFILQRVCPSRLLFLLLCPVLFCVFYLHCLVFLSFPLCCVIFALCLLLDLLCLVLSSRCRFVCCAILCLF